MLAVVLFDWRAHGKTAVLSLTLTSDGLYEEEDFVHIAAAAKAMGCPGKFWFTGYSLGGQLVLWAVKVALEMIREHGDLGLEDRDIGGSMVICPSLDSERSLSYLVTTPFGRYLEAGIAQKKNWYDKSMMPILEALTQQRLNGRIVFGVLTMNW